MSKCNVIFSFLARLKWNFKLHIVLLFTISFLFPLRYFISNCFLQAQASADTNNCQVPWLKFLHQWRSPDSWELTPRKKFQGFHAEAPQKAITDLCSVLRLKPKIQLFLPSFTAVHSWRPLQNCQKYYP